MLRFDPVSLPFSTTFTVVVVHGSGEISPLLQVTRNRAMLIGLEKRDLLLEAIRQREGQAGLGLWILG